MATTKPDPIPDTYRRVTPALVVNGGVKALEFYAEVLGATERMKGMDYSEPSRDASQTMCIRRLSAKRKSRPVCF